MVNDLGLPGRGERPLPIGEQLHLWYIRVSSDREVSEGMEVLSSQERERAWRFRDPLAQRRFIVARRSLRLLLSAYLDLPMGRIVIEIGPEGKPGLGKQVGAELSFNISHSGEWVLLGFANGRSLGVDLEEVTSFRDILQVATKVLTEAEVAALRRMPPDSQTPAFFRGWTRKEALQKARGIGIWDGPARIAAGLGTFSNRPSGMTVEDPEFSRGWTVLGVDAPMGYAAAVAVEGGSPQIETFRPSVDPSGQVE